MINKIRLASAAETLLAAARDLGLLDIVILGDAALHLRDCTIEELQAAAAQRLGVLRCCALLSVTGSTERVALGVSTPRVARSCGGWGRAAEEDL
jgi:hypothetical protein